MLEGAEHGRTTQPGLMLDLLAKALGRPKSALTLLSGQTARVKRIAVEGGDDADLVRAFGEIP